MQETFDQGRTGARRRPVFRSRDGDALSSGRLFIGGDFGAQFQGPLHKDRRRPYRVPGNFSTQRGSVSSACKFFSVISGFIIAYSATGAGALTFLRGRIVRLFPAAWICATGTIVVLLALRIDLGWTLLTRYVDSLTLSPFGPWVDGVYWTLGIEIVFYALIFGLIAANGFRKLIVLCYVIGGMSAAY